MTLLKPWALTSPNISLLRVGVVVQRVWTRIKPRCLWEGIRSHTKSNSYSKESFQGLYPSRYSTSQVLKVTETKNRACSASVCIPTPFTVQWAVASHPMSLIIPVPAYSKRGFACTCFQLSKYHHVLREHWACCVTHPGLQFLPCTLESEPNFCFPCSSNLQLCRMFLVMERT